MDFSQKFDNPNPEVIANQLSRIFYCWLFPLFKYGYRNEIEIKDIYNTAQTDLSEQLGNTLERNWQHELVRAKTKNEKPSLTRAIQATFIKPFILYGILQLIQTVVLKAGQPVILALLIKYFDHAKISTLEEGWLVATALILTAFLATVLVHYPVLALSRIGMQCRIAISSLIYRKLLRLNKSAVAQTAAGQIVNLLSNDVSRFDFAPQFFHYIWIMPILIIIVGAFMYNSIGVAALVGILAFSIQTVPLQGYLSRLKGKLRSKIANHTDRRVQLMSEIISGIRVIKMYSWEKPFDKIVTLVRNLELNRIASALYIWGYVCTLGRFIEKSTLFITIIAYVLLGNQLTSDKVFSMIQYFAVLQLNMAIRFPLGITYFAEAKISAKRIENFLMLDETPVPHLESNIEASEENCGAIKITNVKASWIKNQIVDTLSNINLDIKPGMLCAIVGPIGAGKSSLLQLFLKELPINQGKLETMGRISYASQESWLFASSVRNNILFGFPYIKTKYKTVVQVCGLERDFQIFPNGDHTLVGERGTLLSGGQKARINLARAIYREANIYLLDDPLSSVDTNVAKHLFDKCIVNHLKNKTRVLVTHQLQFLKQVDQIILINNGQIEKIGTYAEFENKELEHLSIKSIHDETTTQCVEKRRSIEQVPEITHMLASTDVLENEMEPLETQELMEKGEIPTSLYIKYCRIGSGICLLLFTIVTIIATQFFSTAIDIWLTYWTHAEEMLTASFLKSANNHFNVFEITTRSTLYENATKSFVQNHTELTSNPTALPLGIDKRLNYIYVYASLLILAIILTAVRTIAIYKICLNSSRELHNKMFSNVLKATMHFFDTNPSGRILNRFSKDVGIVDEHLPRFIFEAIQILSLMVGILMVIFIVTPWMIIPTIFVAILFLMIRKIYLASAQNIKRIEGLTKAPVLSHVSASIEGLTTIRVLHAQSMIAQEFDTLQDQHTSSYFLYIATCQAFGFYLDAISVIFTAILIYQFLIFDDGSTASANVGLAISQSLVLTGMLQYGVRQTAEVSNQMTSVERIMQYTCLEEEKSFESSPTKKPHRDWPQLGKIAFNNLTLQYVANEPPILKCLNVDMQAGSKVGIVGRTGAGKSSLMAALFRLAPTEGSITIDDIDIKEIGLHDLRGKISIIPQEPILFTASIRYNLDPLEKYEDQALWKALEDVELKEHIENLDQQVSQGGSNFSVGQRQLLCLARAILQNNKILVMDEATANVDLQTDQFIQTTIRKNFKDCTVITIAHRLNTVMDSDKVLVMDTGEVVEYGHPFELLQHENGFFTKMLKELGLNMENKLRKIAEDAFSNSFKSITVSSEVQQIHK